MVEGEFGQGVLKYGRNEDEVRGIAWEASLLASDPGTFGDRLVARSVDGASVWSIQRLLRGPSAVGRARVATRREFVPIAYPDDAAFADRLAAVEGGRVQSFSDVGAAPFRPLEAVLREAMRGGAGCGVGGAAELADRLADLLEATPGED
ncbi:hypothetical protein [Georgenia alba]|uniref:Uncharacterized protein n=1 Tax=Georgenia alba TaxID=2233858 RepID=A0ABW2Q732_9MICO